MRIYSLVKKFIEARWQDPVWSKVIASVIVSLFLSICGLGWTILNSLYKNITFKSSLSHLWSFLTTSTRINNFIVIIYSVLSLILIYYLVFRIKRKIKNNNPYPSLKDALLNDVPIYLNINSSEYFYSRLCNTFPGIRGLEWINNSKLATQRLELLLKQPLKFNVNPTAKMYSNPIWMFRDIQSAAIDSFQKVGKNKVLINNNEFRISRIAIFKSNDYYKSFIYIETEGEKQTGVYKYTDNEINDSINDLGYMYEEYGYLNGKKFDIKYFVDGAIDVKGKIVNAENAVFRRRYLSNYNFIITSQEALYNSDKFSLESGQYFNGILQGKIKAEVFFERLYSYKLNTNF